MPRARRNKNHTKNHSRVYAPTPNAMRYGVSSAKTERGFTLIELLVVVSIIGLLASIVFVSLNSARMKARDARRIADVNQLAKAVNLYFDKYNLLPPCGTSSVGGCDISMGSPSTQADSSVDGHFMEFLNEFVSGSPRDPINTLNPPYYLYAYGNGQFPAGSGNFYNFVIATHLETPNHPALQNAAIKDPGFSQWYSVAERR